jgi:hypothetical protein
MLARSSACCGATVRRPQAHAINEVGESALTLDADRKAGTPVFEGERTERKTGVVGLIRCSGEIAVLERRR